MFNQFEMNTNDIQYLLDNAGKQVLINNIQQQAIITNTPLNEFYDGKKITTLSKIKRGDLIDYANSKYLVISESDTKRYNEYKGIMRKCEHEINFKVDEIVTDSGEVDMYGEPIYLTTEIHKLFPVVVDSETFDIQYGKVFNMPTGTILVNVQENVDSLNIKLQNRFLKFGRAWEIVGIDRTKKGLMTITAEITTFTSFDDKENEIAYDYNPNV